MTVEDRVRWDGIFRQRANRPYPAPDPLLLAFVPPPNAPYPRALDLCAGVGQNGLWLAEQGYITDIMDISRVALQRARTEMALRNLRNVNLFQVDVDYVQLACEAYQVVCVFRYLQRNLFSSLKRSVKRGGRVVYETFNVRYLDLMPGFNPRFLLEVGELPKYFDGWHILHSDETTHVSQLVARKP